MMMSEFIERTKFEPTAAEYADIESEYMGCDIDKDAFCKRWVKNGGVQRLCRIRARRIEELEAETESLKVLLSKYEANARELENQIRMFENLKRDIKRLLV
jgi:hypothetical protein